MKVLVTLFQKRKDSSLGVKVVVVAVEDTNEKLHEDTKEKCVLHVEESRTLLVAVENKLIRATSIGYACLRRPNATSGLVCTHTICEVVVIGT